MIGRTNADGGGSVTSDDVTVVKSKVLAGETYLGADTDDEAGTGTMPNRGVVTPSLGVNGTYTIQEGYYAPGSKVTQSIPNNGSINGTLNCGQSKTIPVGYTTGGTITANSLASQTSGNATAPQILNGQGAWVNGSKVTGTMPNYSGYTSTGNYVSSTFRSATSGYVFASPGATGYYTTGSYVRIPATNLTAANIKKGVSIMGITGSFQGYTDSPLIIVKNYSTTDVITTQGFVTTVPGSQIKTKNSLSFYCDPSLSGQQTHNASRIVRLSQIINISSYDYIDFYNSMHSDYYSSCNAYFGVSTNSNMTSNSLTASTNRNCPGWISGGNTVHFENTRVNVSNLTGSYYIYVIWTTSNAYGGQNGTIFDCEKITLTNN